MRILITGGAGFIGSHLCERLLSEGHEVICVDSFYSGKKENVIGYLDNPKFRLIKQDIRLPITGVGKLDRIYNLACPASPVQYQFDPILTIETAIIGTQNMLKLARKTGARMLQASTSEVYGDPLEHPQKESYWGNVDPLGKRACYDEGKRAAEALCKDYHEQYQVDARIIRIFNTYGPRMMFNDGRVLSNFIVQALLGENITVHGDGTQTRSFCYVDDLVEGMIRRLESDRVDWQPVNLGNPDERSIGDLAQLVKETTGSNSKIILQPFTEIPNRLGDPKQRCPDITRAKTLLSWEPKIDFTTGLQKTIADFKQRLTHKPRLLVFLGHDKQRSAEAREILIGIIERSPNWEFDVVTNDSSLSDMSGVTVHRAPASHANHPLRFVRWSARMARRLHKKHNYQIAWVLAVGKAQLGAALFSWRVHGRVPLLLTALEQEVSEEMLQRGKKLSGFYQFFMRYVYRWQVVAELTSEQVRWLEEERHVSAINYTGNLDIVAQNTKQLLQELEILATRL